MLAWAQSLRRDRQQGRVPVRRRVARLLRRDGDARRVHAREVRASGGVARPDQATRLHAGPRRAHGAGGRRGRLAAGGREAVRAGVQPARGATGAAAPRPGLPGGRTPAAGLQQRAEARRAVDRRLERSREPLRRGRHEHERRGSRPRGVSGERGQRGGAAGEVERLHGGVRRLDGRRDQRRDQERDEQLARRRAAVLLGRRPRRRSEAHAAPQPPEQRHRGVHHVPGGPLHAGRAGRVTQRADRARPRVVLRGLPAAAPPPGAHGDFQRAVQRHGDLHAGQVHAPHQREPDDAVRSGAADASGRQRVRHAGGRGAAAASGQRPADRPIRYPGPHGQLERVGQRGLARLAPVLRHRAGRILRREREAEQRPRGATLRLRPVEHRAARRPRVAAARDRLHQRALDRGWLGARSPAGRPGGCDVVPAPRGRAHPQGRRPGGVGVHGPGPEPGAEQRDPAMEPRLARPAGAVRLLLRLEQHHRPPPRCVLPGPGRRQHAGDLRAGRVDDWPAPDGERRAALGARDGAVLRARGRGRAADHRVRVRGQDRAAARPGVGCARRWPLEGLRQLGRLLRHLQVQPVHGVRRAPHADLLLHTGHLRLAHARGCAAAARPRARGS